MNDKYIEALCLLLIIGGLIGVLALGFWVLLKIT